MNHFWKICEIIKFLIEALKISEVETAKDIFAVAILISSKHLHSINLRQDECIFF